MGKYVAINIDGCIAKFFDSCVAEIGSDPQGWDRHSTTEEHIEFMKVNNHELSIERLQTSRQQQAVHAKQ